jgi:transposase
MENQIVNNKILCQKNGCQKLTRKKAKRIVCPDCGYRQFYKLSDGRRQCIRCRKKFTPRDRKPRLPKETIKEIVRLFWLMVPAARVAQNLGVNPKTVLRYYHLIRENIAQKREQELAQLAGEIEVDESYFGGVRKGKRGRGAAGKVPVFGLLKRNGEVRVVFPKRVDKKSLQGAIKEHVKPQSWVYSDSYRAYDRLHLEGFHHVRISHSEGFATGKAHINGIENFWGFAKRRLKMYHGGYKKNLPLFIREMEFRFNHRKDNNVIDYLFGLVTLGPN